jgi:hypothetical protein
VKRDPASVARIEVITEVGPEVNLAEELNVHRLVADFADGQNEPGVLVEVGGVINGTAETTKYVMALSVEQSIELQLLLEDRTRGAMMAAELMR